MAIEVNFISTEFADKLKIIAPIAAGARVAQHRYVIIVATATETWLYAKNHALSAYLRVGSKVLEPGVIALGVDELVGVVKTYPKNTLVELRENVLTSATFTNIIAQTPVDNLPNWPVLASPALTLPLAVKFATLTWADKVFFSQGYLVGITNNAAQVGMVPSDLHGDFYLPREAVQIISGLSDPVDVWLNGQMIIAKNDLILVSGLTPMPKVPPFLSLLPDSINHIHFTPPSGFGDALANAKTINNVVSLAQDGQTMQITSNKIDVGDAEIILTLPNSQGAASVKILATQLTGALKRAPDQLIFGPKSVTLLNEKLGYIEVISAYMPVY